MNRITHEYTVHLSRQIEHGEEDVVLVQDLEDLIEFNRLLVQLDETHMNHYVIRRLITMIRQRSDLFVDTDLYKIFTRPFLEIVGRHL